MKRIKNLTGFMLGNDNCVHLLGCAWLPRDSRVWICRNMAKAEKILQESQQNCMRTGCIWTTIYRVVANDIVCEQSGDGMWYTNTPTKIFVDGIVKQCRPDIITEQDLLMRARDAKQKFAKLVEGIVREDEK